MIRTSLVALALGGLGLAACSSTPPAPTALKVGASEEAFTDLPTTVDETALDRTANPCDDFYQFACGGYINSIVLKNDFDHQARRGTQNQAVNDEVLAEIIAKSSANRRNPEDQKVADHFASCMAWNASAPQPGQLTAALAGEIATLRTALRAGGKSALLGRALSATLTRLAGTYQPVFEVATDVDSVANVVVLSVAPVFDGTLEVSVDDVLAAVGDYYPNMSAEDAAARANLVFGVDTALADAVAGFSFNKPKPTSKRDLARAMPHVDWDVLLSTFGAANAKHISADGLDALAKIDGVIASLSPDDLANYLEYKLLFKWSLFDGAVGPASAAKVCGRSTAEGLPGIMEHRFVDTVVGRKNVAKVKVMAERIRSTFIERLATTSFLDDTTRAEAVKKAQAMIITPLLEPRDRYRDVPIVPGDFFGNEIRLVAHDNRIELAQIDHAPGHQESIQARGFEFSTAFYEPYTNTFTVFPGLAHGMTFGGPAPHNYGGLGVIIGHEITHGFDNDGRVYDAVGAQRDWWSPAADAAFRARSACFVDQYAAFVVEGVTDPDTGGPVHPDGNVTLGENIADNGGVRNAYQAAAPLFATSHDDAGFTPAQQFFLANGQFHCEKGGPGYLLSKLSFDVHAPNKARVNVTLSNFDKFAEAFQCKPGDRMVAPQACGLW